MAIDSALLQAVCEQVANEIAVTVSIFAADGEIVASSQTKAIGEILTEGATLLAGRADSMEIAGDATAGSTERCFLPIELDGVRAYGIAIMAPLDVARRYCRISRSWILSHLKAARGHEEYERSLAASEQRFRDVAESAGDWIWEMDADLRRVEAWVNERLTRRRELGAPHVHQRGDGRWVMVSERRTQDGGTVAVYSDITDLKQREEQLSAKSKSLEMLSAQLSKYLAPQVYTSIFSGKSEVKVASQRKKLTIFFSDIAGFTETADRMESEDLTQLLNHYLSEMSKIALAYGATIDKYVGDAIVIFFGDPETRGVKEDAVACVRMAIAMRARMLELADVWRASGIIKPLMCRVGINTGYSTVGNFGSEDRMDYTIIGGGVNLASRLENGAEPGQILVSYETYAHIKDEIYCEYGGDIKLRGIAYPVAVYRVVDSYEALGRERNRVHEEQANLKLKINIDAMSDDEIGRAAATLRQALERLYAAKPEAKLPRRAADELNPGLGKSAGKKSFPKQRGRRRA